MATITFPSNPVLNQIYSYGGNTWIWDGSSWQLLTNAALNAVVIGNVVPDTGAFTVLTANSLSVNSLTANSISSGTIAANTIAGGALTGTTLSLSGNVLSALRVQGPVSGTSFSTVGAITTNNGITSFGNISAPFFIGDGSLLTGIPSGTNYSNANVASYLPTYTGNLQAGNVSILGNIAGTNISVLGRIVSSGNITSGNLLTSGTVSAGGNVVGNYVFGNGFFLSGINANYSNANVAAYLPTNTANVAANNFIGNGYSLTNINASNVTGTVTSAATAAFANTAAVANSVAGANVTGTVANATNAAFANYAYSVPAAGVIGNVAIANTALTANVANSVAGANVTGTVANATYATTAGSATTATSATTAASANSVPGSGVIGPVAQANVATLANSAVTVAGANVTGTVANATYAITSGSATTAATVTNAAQPNITSVGTLASVTTTGNIVGTNINLSGRVSAAGNIIGSYFIGNGALLTGLATSNYSNANVAAYLPTYTGNLSASSATFTSVAANTLSAAAITGTTVSASGNITGGNLRTAGAITASGNVTAANYFGNGAFLTGIAGNYSNANVAAYLPTYTGNISAAQITLSGSLSSAGNVSAVNINASAGVVSSNTISANLATFSTRVTAANIVATGPISAAGNISGNYILGNGAFLSGMNTYGNANVAAYLPTYTGAITGATVSTTGNITGDNIYATGNVFAVRTISAVGNITGGNLTTTGWISSIGNVSSPYYFGNGFFLTGIQTNYSNANVAAYLQSYTGNLSSGNISVTGNVNAQYFVGNGVYLSGIQATSVGTLPSLSVTGNIRTGNLSAAGNVIGNFFIGNGSQLTGMYGNANVANYLPTYSGNITANYFIGDGSLLTNLPITNYSNANVAAYLPTYSGNITANVISAAGNITANYYIGNGALLTGIQATDVGVLPSLSVTGNTITGNLSSLGLVSAIGNIVTGNNIFTSNLYATGVVSATGNISAGNVSSVGQVIAAGNITARVGSFFIGNGSLLTGVVAISAPASGLTGNILSSNVIYSSLQTVGTLSNLNVAGTTTTTNLVANTVVSTTGSVVANVVYANSASLSGNITSQYFVGNGALLTGIVANTTYSNSNVAAYLPTNSANVAGNYFIGNGALLTGIVANTTYSNSNVAAYLPTNSANVAGNYFIGNGAGITYINGGNVVGTVPSAEVVTTAAQPTITSVGTLTSLSVSGNVRATGLISATGNVTGQYFIGNGSLLTGIIANTSYSNSNVAAYLPTYTGNITGGNLTVTSRVAGATVSASGNITGNYFIGNGSQLTGITANYSNANVAAYLPTYTGNITGDIVSTTGNITAPYFIGNGSQLTGLPASYSNANVAAYLPTYSGNLAGGNLSVSGNIAGNYLFGNASQLTGIPATLTVSNWFTGNVIANSLSNISALRFNGNTGITVQSLGAGEALVSLGSSFKTWEVAGQANLVAVGEDIVQFVAGPGINITTNAVSYPQQIQFNANVSNISNGTSNIVVLPNGNVNVGVAGANLATFSATGLTVTGNVAGNYILGNGAFLTGLPASYSNANVAAYLPTYTGNITADTISTTGNITAPYFFGNGSQLTGITASNVGTLTNLTVTGNITTGNIIGNGSISTTGNITGAGGTFNGDLNVVGNISATGNINYINVTDLVVGDPLIYFAANNTGNLLDIGWVGSYDDGTYQHTGLVRDHTDGVWKLFSNVVQEPTTVIDWANAQYDQFQSGEITSTANISAVGNITGNVFIGNGAGLTTIIGSNVTGTVASASTAGTVTDAAQSNITSVGTLTSLSSSGNITAGAGAYFIGDGSQLTNLPGGNALGNTINMGSNTQGVLVSNAVTLTANTTVTNGIALLNQVLGKLVPPAPTNFPGATTLAVSSLSTYRMANFVQTDNTPGANKSVSGGTTVTTVRRAASYSTNTVANVGPGDSGTVIAVLNGADAGNVTLTSGLTGNGVYSNLVITNNYDYNRANANITAGFWSVFTSQASGSVPQGWNEVRIADTATANTNTPSWYYDASAPGTPGIGNLTITANTTSLTYSSTVGHYNSSTQFALGFTANRLSGDMYPTSDTFVTGSAGGAFQAPVSVTYSTAGVTTPLARNLYVSSGSQSVSTTANIVTGFSASSTGPSVSVLNSYATGTSAFTTALSANVLYKTGTASTMEESNVVVGSSIGSGSGLAYRIVNPGSTDTPVYTGSEAAFNSQTSTLETYDATIVAAVLKHDQTNYSTGYLPIGPDLSSGRTGAQYFTFKIVRTSVSKFDVKWTGTLAGLWVALPGSAIDTSSTLNGWLDMSTAYAGAGQPGAGSGGNGSNGCALGGVAPLNSAQTNKAITATFGTVSSSSTATNEIYIRIKLTSGQSITALSLQTASN